MRYIAATCVQLGCVLCLPPFRFTNIVLSLCVCTVHSYAKIMALVMETVSTWHVE